MGGQPDTPKTVDFCSHKGLAEGLEFGVRPPHKALKKCLQKLLVNIKKAFIISRLEKKKCACKRPPVSFVPTPVLRFAAMNELHITTRHVGLHRLEPRYAHFRGWNPQRLNRLITSMERDGQQRPVIAVPLQGVKDRWVLIDGYLRLEALQRVGEDLVWVDVWDISEKEALLAFLGRCQERAWMAIEEAALIRELHNGFSYSLSEISREMGRSKSWVSNRLALINDLPEPLFAAVREGWVSLWAAIRILMPFARANSEHAMSLLLYIKKTPLSTRDLKRFFQHYQQATQKVRERMAGDPDLFFQAVRNEKQKQDARLLQEGPQGAWIKELSQTENTLKRLERQVPTLFDEQDPSQKRHLIAAFERVWPQIFSLEETIRRYMDNDLTGNPSSHCDDEGTGHPGKGDQPNIEDFPQCREARSDQPESRPQGGG